MKWNININQKAIVDLGIDIDVIDASILDQCFNYSHDEGIAKIFLRDKVYYWFDYNQVIRQLPLLKIKSKDSVYRRFKKMTEVGLLEPHPNNQSLGRPYYAFSNLCVQCTYGYKTEGTDLKPEGYGSKVGGGTDQKSDDNYINDNYIKDNKGIEGTIVPPPSDSVSDKKKRKRTVFQKPTEEEVFDYMSERNHPHKAEANKFFDYYESKGWMVGKNKMIDWKASVRGWLGRVKGYNPNASKPTGNKPSFLDSAKELYGQ